jgi:hypothetical protein
MGSASFLGQHPRTARHRRLMTHMLPMAAGEIGYPILVFVQMIGHDRLIHAAAPFELKLD